VDRLIHGTAHRDVGRRRQLKMLERLCRHFSRPAIAEKRLSLTPNGKVCNTPEGMESAPMDAEQRKARTVSGPS